MERFRAEEEELRKVKKKLEEKTRRVRKLEEKVRHLSQVTATAPRQVSKDERKIQLQIENDEISCDSQGSYDSFFSF